MSNLKYAIVETESSSVEAQARHEEPKLFVVPSGREGSGEPITRRVEEVLDYEFAQGSMPA
jgi:hypothetical protein